MFLDNQKHQPAVKVSEKSQSERGNFGHLCVAIETDAVFLSLFKSDFIKKWMDGWKMKGCAGWVPTGENKEHILLPVFVQWLWQPTLRRRRPPCYIESCISYF